MQVIRTDEKTEAASFFFGTRLKLHLAMHTINGLSSAQQSFHNPVNRVARLDPSPFSALHPPVPWPLHGLHACISMAMALGPVLDHKCLLRASFAVTRALRPGAYTSPSLARIDASEHSTHMHATTKGPFSFQNFLHGTYHIESCGTYMEY